MQTQLGLYISVWSTTNAGRLFGPTLQQRNQRETTNHTDVVPQHENDLPHTFDGLR